MHKTIYVYNPETCNYEPFKPKKQIIFLKYWGLFILALTLAASGLHYLSLKFDTPKESKFKAEKEILITQLELLEHELIAFDVRISEMAKRDDELYRVLLEGQYIPPSMRDAGVGGSNNFVNIEGSNLVNKHKIHETYLKLDKIKRQMYIQTLSFDELQALANERNRMYASIPSIQPIYNKELRRLSTIYGIRFHPILKKYRPHRGLDFMAPKNTSVYATGDGIVIATRYSKTLGNVVEIDHGFGYLSRYAHLDGFNVEKGQNVKRGMTIGFIGNTGLSLSNHLHYEIEKDNAHVNPIGYFQRELSDKEYEKLIDLSKVPTVPLD